MTPYDEKAPRRPVSLATATLFRFAVVLCVLVWGSAHLVRSIADLKMAGSPPASALAPPEPPFQVDGAGRPALNFSAVRDGLFVPEYRQLQWVREPQSLTNDKGTYLIEEKAGNGTQYLVKSIVDDDFHYTLRNSSRFSYDGVDYEIDRLTASPDLQRALVRTNSTKNFRWSTFAVYWVLDVAANTVVPVSTTTDKLATAVWSPDSRQVAFVLDNNVYVRDGAGAVHQVTSDGSADVFNGITDWAYEEEVFGSRQVLAWSPDSQSLAFLRFNDTQVPSYTIPYYFQRDHQAYPDMRALRYPKPGFANPDADVLVYSTGTGRTAIVDLHTNITSKLVTDLQWVAPGKLLTRISNRASDLVEYHVYDDAEARAVLTRQYAAHGSWFEVTFNVLPIPQNDAAGLPTDGYIDTVVVDGYEHLAYFAHAEASHGLLLTKGVWEVISDSIAFDYATNDLYFSATKKAATERHLYSVNLASAVANTSLPVVRNITDVSSDGYYSGSFSSGSRYLLLTYKGPDVPYQQLVDLQQQKVLKTLETNDDVRQNLESHAIPQDKYFTLKYHEADGNTLYANAKETLPLAFDPSKKYPVIFFVYGGPGSQTVAKTFSIGFSSVLAAELNAVVVTVDGRGTGYNNLNAIGSQFKFIVRENLGNYESQDQISAAKIWRAKSYVDPDRIAIWGWSYGGYMTLKTLETDVGSEKVFSYGVSIAPVTDWRFYDSVYTERYMNEPGKNEQGYEQSAIHKMDNFKQTKRFFICHGTGDDNVHFQNTLKVIDDLNLNTIENFDFFAFPDSDHSISYHNGNIVVYDRILGWFRQQFWPRK